MRVRAMLRSIVGALSIADSLSGRIITMTSQLILMCRSRNAVKSGELLDKVNRDTKTTNQHGLDKIILLGHTCELQGGRKLP